MIKLNYENRRPIYKQVAEKLQLLILTGVLESGSQMQSVRQLALELSVNPNTIQRAYMELLHQGYIYSVKGKGNYIADAEEIKRKMKTAFYQELKNLIMKAPLVGAEKEEVTEIVRDCYKEAEKTEIMKT